MKPLVRTVVFAAFGLVLALSGLAVRLASAHEPHPGLNFSIGVQDVSGCNTRAGDVTCTLASGQPFVLEAWLDSLPDDIPSYGGFDLYVEYSGVSASDDASNDIWPDCGFPASHPEPTFIAWGCAIGIPPAGPSSWEGPIGTVTFTCGQNGTITMVHKAGSKTDLIESAETSQSVIHAEGDNTEEKLTINCGQVSPNTPGIVQGTPGPPGGTPGQAHPGTGVSTSVPVGTPGPTLEPTAAAQATGTALARGTDTPEASPTPGGSEEDDDDGSNTWVWIVIGVAAAVVVIGGGGYLYMRNRSGGSPPPTGGSAGGTAPTSGGGTPTAGGGAPPSGGTPPSNGGTTPSSGGGSTTT